MAIVRVSGESLGEMAWKVYKEEIIRLIMIQVRWLFDKEREKLENARNLGDRISPHVEKVVGELEICYDLFKNSATVVEKDLEDCDPVLRKGIRDALIREAKKLARRSDIGGEK